MSNKKHIDNKIKESFDQMQSSAPIGLWDSISENLDIPFDTNNIDKYVKDSFEKSINHAPEHVWEAVNRQLYIDSAWKGVKRFLNIRTSIYNWSRIAALILILLLLIPSSYYSFNNLKVEKNIISEETKIIVSPQINKEVNSKNIENCKEELKTNNKKETIFKNNNLLTISTLQSDNFKKITPLNNKLSNNTSENIILNNQLTVIKEEDCIKKFTKEFTTIKKTPITIQDSAKKTFAFDFNNIILPKFANDTVTKKDKRFEIGIVYSYNNTWLLNNNTRNSFDKTSLVSTYFTFTNNYGIVGNYNLSKSSALSSEFYLNSETKQQYGIYIEGKYFDKKIALKYSKLTLLYQYNYSQDNAKISSKNTIKIGTYIAGIKSTTKYYNSVISSENTEYSNFDYGLKIAIGQEKNINSFILSYGINAEYGLKNIYTGNIRMSKTFNKTRNSNVGIYLIFKYKL